MVPGGRFYRGCDRAPDDTYKDMTHPAILSPFALDRYEVTVGRFRAFVGSGQGTLAKRPADAAGTRPGLPNSGWDSRWDASLSSSTAELVASIKCDAKYQTWTDAPGPNENKPIGCVTWYEAMAFCIWDGGYLPTEAEWNFAAGGGSEHRAYPWSRPADATIVDCGHANYQISTAPVAYCVNGTVGGASRVGAESPAGDGKWGHSDLTGNVWEWTLDWYAAAYPDSCMDCASLTPSGKGRVLRGGSFFNDDLAMLRADYRLERPPSVRAANYGVRCARLPSP
jgi:formylglycine-generating enzyme required for sulfatase activity